MEKYKNHYVYEIQNLINNMKYIGVRSTNLKPEDDLGNIYFSSSLDKDFILEQKEHPNRFKYIILEVFDCRKTAMEREIVLHQIFSVKNNHLYYNKTNQLFTGFDHSGCKHSKKTRAKMSTSHKGKIVTEETREKIRNTLTGRKRLPFSVEHIQNLSKAKKGKKITVQHKNNISKVRLGMKWYHNSRGNKIMCKQGDPRLLTDNWKQGMK